MGIIVFLVDTSASMNQRTYLGSTLLDIAKGAVETFIKLRARAKDSHLDRYMLVTFDEPPFCIKSGWKESLGTFTNELKYMRACGTTSLGVALKETFDLLNSPRPSAGTDSYGLGRLPTIQEPAVILALTDVGCMHNTADLPVEKLELPMTNSPLGSELTKEPFRWDQRLFSLMLRIPGRHPAVYDRAHQGTFTEMELQLMSEQTGGKAYLVTSAKTLSQCLDSIALKVQHTGVVLHFEKKIGSEPKTALGGPTGAPSHINGNSGLGDEPMDVGDDGMATSSVNGSRTDGPRSVGRATALQDEDTGDQGRAAGEPAGVASAAAAQLPAWHSCMRIIFVKHDPRSVPIKPHWPIPEGFWQDSHMSSLPVRRAHPVVTFSCETYGLPKIQKFPFDKYELEPSPLTQFLLQNNPPNICWQVFVEKSSRSPGLGAPFGYLKTSVSGNAVSLFVMPYNYPVLLQILDDLVKQKFRPTAQLQNEFQHYVHSIPVYYVGPLRNALIAFGGRAVTALFAEGLPSTNVALEAQLSLMKKQGKENFDKMCNSILRRANKDNGESLSVYPAKEPIRLQTFRNAFDISRKNLVAQVASMRKNLMPASSSSIRPQDEEERHSLPVSQTGNYQDHLKKFAPLRDLDSGGRPQMFGNPFRLESKGRGMVLDEANEAIVGVNDSSNKRAGSPVGGPSPKRRPGTPRSQRFANRTPPVSPLPSPASSGSASLQATSSGGGGGGGGDGTNEFGLPAAGGNSERPVTAIERSATGAPLQQAPLSQDQSATAAAAASSSSSLSPAAPPAKNTTASTGDAQGPTPSSNTASVAAHGRPQAGESNSNIRGQLLREVRKPGKSADRVLEMLGEVRGSLQERMAVCSDIRKEALRFKRHKLVVQLDSWVHAQQQLSENQINSS